MNAKTESFVLAIAILMVVVIVILFRVALSQGDRIDTWRDLANNGGCDTLKITELGVLVRYYPGSDSIVFIPNRRSGDE